MNNNTCAFWNEITFSNAASGWFLVTTYKSELYGLYIHDVKACISKKTANLVLCTWSSNTSKKKMNCIANNSNKCFLLVPLIKILSVIVTPIIHTYWIGHNSWIPRMHENSNAKVRINFQLFQIWYYVFPNVWVSFICLL